MGKNVLAKFKMVLANQAISPGMAPIKTALVVSQQNLLQLRLAQLIAAGWTISGTLIAGGRATPVR